MSRAHDGHHRSIFPFGNPFKAGQKKDSHLSAKLYKIQQTFEENLAVNLTKLKPEVGADISSLSWMRNAVEFLYTIHGDLNTLIDDLDLPVSQWEQSWIDLYLDDSVKLLDVCNAFTSQVSRCKQCQLLLICVLHLLGQANGAPSEVQLKKSHNYLSEWRQLRNSRNTKLESSASILKALSGSLHVPHFKKWTKGKVLMRAMYAVKVITIFLCGVLSAVLTSSLQLLIDFGIPEEFLWALPFNNLQTDVNREIRSKFSSGRVVAFNEMDTVGQCVNRLFFVTSDSIASLQRAASEHREPEDLNRSKTVEEDTVKLILEIYPILQTNVDILSDGLDNLSKELEKFFTIVMKGRDALLGNLKRSDVFQHKGAANGKAL